MNTGRFLSQRSPRRVCCGLAACVAIGAIPAFADETLITFDTYPDGAPVLSFHQLSDQWLSLGVTFSNSTGGPIGVASSTCSYSLPNHVGADLVVVRFFDPLTGGPASVRAVSCRQDWCWGQGEGLDLKIYDVDGQLLDAVWSVGGGSLASFSFAEPIIAKLTCATILQGMDDLSFETPVPIRPADVNGDGSVNGTDLAILLGAWGQCPTPCGADIDRSGGVDAVDLSILLGDWG
jgi:hypothetical protein